MSSNFKLFIFLLIFLSMFLVFNWIYSGTRSTPSIKIMSSITTPKIMQLNPLIIFPVEDQMNIMSETDLADLYHNFMQTATFDCKKIIRAGTIGDGGWNVCVDPEYVPKKPCLVYSFGIGSDSSFDLFVHTTYGCEVHSFDPTLNDDQIKMINPVLKFHPIGLSDQNQVINQQTYNTLLEIRKSLGHLKTELSILKIDIEMWEWQSLRHSIPNTMLDDVHQLLIEFHLFNLPNGPRALYLNSLPVLRDLQDLGFRIFSSERNEYCQFLTENNINRTACHNIHFVKLT